MVRAHCAEVGAPAASVENKLGSTKLVTYAKARYKAKIATWTLKEQYDIDKIFYAFHTKTTKNMRTFPYDLLYLNKERGGAGLQRFSDAVKMDKLAELLRAYRRTDEVAEAAKGVVERALRYQGTHKPTDRKTCVLPVKGKSHWLCSTLEWLTKHNLFLWRGGTTATADQLSRIIQETISDVPKPMLRRLENDMILHE